MDTEQSLEQGRILYISFVALIGFAVPFSYSMIIGNLSGLFPIKSSSYLDSPYWLTLPRRVRPLLVLLQLLAAIGYIGVQTWIVLNLGNLTSFLQNRILLVNLNLALIFASALWSISAYYVVTMPGSTIAILTSSCFLSITAGCGITFLIGLIDESAHPVVIVGNIAFCIVTVLADALWWNFASLQRYMRHPRQLK